MKNLFIDMACTYIAISAHPAVSVFRYPFCAKRANWNANAKHDHTPQPQNNSHQEWKLRMHEKMIRKLTIDVFKIVNTQADSQRVQTMKRSLSPSQCTEAASKDDDPKLLQPKKYWSLDKQDAFNHAPKRPPTSILWLEGVRYQQRIPSQRVLMCKHYQLRLP